MSDLPNNGITISFPQDPTPQATGGIAVGKEGEITPSQEQSVQEITKEIELPKEIVAAGVKKQPTVVHLPPSVQRMGVKPTGVNTQFGNGQTVTLPLTQPQIAQGLQQSIADSWRWLAVWCIRKLKQLRFLNQTN